MHPIIELEKSQSMGKTTEIQKGKTLIINNKNLFGLVLLLATQVITGCLAQNYRATYQANFQYYQKVPTNCNGPYPQLTQLPTVLQGRNVDRHKHV